jgi:cell division protein ZapA
VEDSGADKKVVRVTIFQQPYALRTSGDPAETEALAEAVDSLMNRIAARTAGADPARVAVLACLHLADQLRQLERAQDRIAQRLAALDQRLSELADAEDAR